MASAAAYFDTSVLVKPYVNEPGSTRARQLLRRLRTLDAIHVASALLVVEGMARRVPFVTADATQRAAAQRFLEVVCVE